MKERGAVRREEEGEYYSPPPFGSHNLSYEALIDEPFAATRSSRRALHFYLSKLDVGRSPPR
ncbi:uncharacterized protein DS421_20g695160 [Arachis hypogaea]|nr:uncharacterized protein DS421_20g695160 [Arachis hypogaea]